MKKTQKPELIAFTEYKIGGVQSFYYNLLTHASADSFIIQWIYENTESTDTKLPATFGVGREEIVEVGIKESMYAIAKRLGKLVSNRPGIVLTNFYFELAAMHLHRKPQKTIFFFCHDDGYLWLAQKYEFLIDVFLAHNIYYYNLMVEMLPHRKPTIFYIPYGITVKSSPVLKGPNPVIKIVIACRLQKSKGIFELEAIDDLLIKENVLAHWTVIGDGPEKETLIKILSVRSNFEFHSPKENDGVRQLMEKNDVFVLPSQRDGLPVAMLEAMSVGCVPIVSEFNPGITQILEGTGFVVSIGDVAGFAQTIKYLYSNPQQLQDLQKKSIQLINERYNQEKQAKLYFDLFLRYKELKMPIRRKFILYEGWLGLPFVPSWIRMFVRHCKQYFTSAYQ